jgi:molybdate transport system regulatory protein
MGLLMYRLDLKIRLHNGSDIALGPGKADLLESIQQHGSISAAARALGMSYRRAWLLVETMNRSFSQPLVSTLAGGKHGGGTQLTVTGEHVLRCYRGLCAQAQAAVQAGCDELAELLAEAPPALDSEQA